MAQQTPKKVSRREVRQFRKNSKLMPLLTFNQKLSLDLRLHSRFPEETREKQIADKIFELFDDELPRQNVAYIETVEMHVKKLCSRLDSPSQLMDWSVIPRLSRQSSETYDVYEASKCHSKKLIHLYKRAHSERIDIGNQACTNQISKNLAESVKMSKKLFDFLEPYATKKLTGQVNKLIDFYNESMHNIDLEHKKWTEQANLLQNLQQKQLERIRPFVETSLILKKLSKKVNDKGFNTGDTLGKLKKKKYPFYLNEKADNEILKRALKISESLS